MKQVAIILVGGSSTRFQSDIPKQLFPINGRPLLDYTIHSFEDSPDIDEIVIVINEQYEKEITELLNNGNYKKIKHLVSGGKSRQESAFFGLLSLEKELEPTDRVLIHDGARPLVDKDLIHELFESLNTHYGATVALPCTDTVCMVDKNSMELVGSLNRDEIYMVQTPQAFRYQAILDAHKLYRGKEVTDDTQLLLGVTPIKIIKGNKKLLKITTKEDILFLEVYLKEGNL